MSARRHSRAARATVLVMAAISIAAVTAQSADTCDGAFTVAGATAKLAFASAGIDRLFSEPGKDYIRVVLSDTPLPPAAAADDFALQRLTRDRKLHAVVLIVNPDKAIASTQLFDAGFNMDSVSSAGTNNQLETTVFTRERIAGSAFTKQPREFRGVRYDFRATFSAAIRRD